MRASIRGRGGSPVASRARLARRRAAHLAGWRAAHRWVLRHRKVLSTDSTHAREGIVMIPNSSSDSGRTLDHRARAAHCPAAARPRRRARRQRRGRLALRRPVPRRPAPLRARDPGREERADAPSPDRQNRRRCSARAVSEHTPRRGAAPSRSTVSSPIRPEPSTGVLVIDGPIDAADVPLLCARLRSLLDGTRRMSSSTFARWPPMPSRSKRSRVSSSHAASPRPPDRPAPSLPDLDRLVCFVGLADVLPGAREARPH